jgi:hypothetical protein
MLRNDNDVDSLFQNYDKTPPVFTKTLVPINNNDNNTHAYTSQLNNFTYLRALTVLHDRSI